MVYGVKHNVTLFYVSIHVWTVSALISSTTHSSYILGESYVTLQCSLSVSVTELDSVVMSCICDSKQRVATYVEVNLKYWVLNKLMISSFVKKWSFLGFCNTYTSILHTRKWTFYLLCFFLSASKLWPMGKWDVFYFIYSLDDFNVI